MEVPKKNIENQTKIKLFYDTVYYKDASTDVTVSKHLHRLAKKIRIHRGQKILDVGCGTGAWLLAASERGAESGGIDLSPKAIEICKKNMPDGMFYAGPAEILPFEDNCFDIVSCLGALEHFLKPETALKEMVRVAKKDAYFLLLVPNADFLTRRLGFYHGTHQTDFKEEIKTLAEWNKLFESAGLKVTDRWKDLHVFSWPWINAKSWYHVPYRAAQAIALTLWPIPWQYQVYHLCEIKQHPID